uniref:DUF475 domain-containing protein n=1 Tax=Altererythrobacter segetis TaxID=1104773 RepID=UPI00140C1F1B|nr:DUF475 domain-containing protein [Altererythrobacter segetis]
MLRQFRGSILFALVAFALAGWYGWSHTQSAAGTIETLWIVLVLSVLEVSLSFDNAVVNATVLKQMDPVWQKRFLTWGMVIAVWGMYILFPLVIVAVAAQIGPVEAAHLSLEEPARYEAIVSSAHGSIAGFGGAFLGMVGLKFFFDEEKDVHWVRTVERFLSGVSTVRAAEIAVLLLALWAVSAQLPSPADHSFLIAGILGVVVFIAIDGLGTLMKKREERQRKAGALVNAGLGGFLYLNVLDASFSFDAVIGAFALSNNMVVIALGLSIGAMFVRSMTVMLVRKGTLGEYRYLEHGAFWAILALAAIMLLSAKIEVPETVTGLIGAVLIGFSLLWSVRHNRRDARSG